MEMNRLVIECDTCYIKRVFKNGKKYSSSSSCSK